MRIIAIVLVILGALALGYQGFTCVSHEDVMDAGSFPVTAEKRTIWIPPVVGGIAVTSGLIILAANSKRD